MDQKSILRTEKNRSNPYVMINKGVFNDDRISWKAKGIMGYLLSKPDNWEIRVSDLIKHSKDGRDSVLAGLKELKKSGYIVQKRERDEMGRMRGSIYTVYEEPRIEEGEEPKTENPVLANQPKTDFPELGFPELGFPDTGNPTLINNESTNEREITKNERDITTDTSPKNVVVDSPSILKLCEDIKSALGVKAGKEKIATLVNQYGENHVRKVLQTVEKQHYVYHFSSPVGVLVSQCEEEWDMSLEPDHKQSVWEDMERKLAETWGLPC